MTTGNKTTSAATASKTTLVVGATSSLAQALCRALAKRGRALVLTGREEEELALLASDLQTRFGISCRTLVVNLLDPEFSAAAVIDAAQPFDEMVLAVGDMGDGSDDDEAIARAAYINYVAPAQLAAQAAKELSERGGLIAIISSVAGERGRRKHYGYGSAKAALTSFASGLRSRYADSRVHVLTIKPGFIDTPMTWGMKSPLIASREYAAEKIVSAMERKKDVVYVPWFWCFIMLIIRSIPERIFKKLSI